MIAQLREEFDAIAGFDKIRRRRVDVARIEVVLGAHGFDFLAERQEDFKGAVVGTAFYDGHSTVFGTEEAYAFDNGAE